jgi:DNA adenine methylase
MAKPIIKWSGGKQRLVAQLTAALPADIAQRRHVELFAGGASLLLSRTPLKGWLSDANPHLISMYMAVTRTPQLVMQELATLRDAHAKVHYYYIRDRFNQNHGSSEERAAMFIYLNQTCYNGLWRVNRKGEFNVPLGDYKKPNIYDEARINEAASVLQNVALTIGSFADLTSQITADDFVYLDPPYAPISAGSFVSYTSGGFTMDDQVALRDAVVAMTATGAKVMLTNSDTIDVRELYKDFILDTVSTVRSISRNTDQRGKISELLVRNYAD